MEFEGYSSPLGFVYRKLVTTVALVSLIPYVTEGTLVAVLVKLVAGNSVGYSPRKCRGLWATRVVGRGGNFSGGTRTDLHPRQLTPIRANAPRLPSLKGQGLVTG